MYIYIYILMCICNICNMYIGGVPVVVIIIVSHIIYE